MKSHEGAHLFVSDVHLCESRPEIVAQFERLTRDVRRASSFYILGDLFEYWPGDDDLAAPLHQRVIRALHALKTAGTQVLLMHGNRDFLIANAFAEAAGVTLIEDSQVAVLNGEPTLLLHGDTLCTDDRDYQTLRATLRTADWQAQFLAQPLAERKATIADLRAMSEREKSRKSEDIMDVNEQAVLDAFQHCGCRRMIHGHTHRPGHHRYDIDGRIYERWVLGDWYRQGSYLKLDADGIAPVSLEDLPP